MCGGIRHSAEPRARSCAAARESEASAANTRENGALTTTRVLAPAASPAAPTAPSLGRRLSARATPLRIQNEVAPSSLVWFELEPERAREEEADERERGARDVGAEWQERVGQRAHLRDDADASQSSQEPRHTRGGSVLGRQPVKSRPDYLFAAKP